MSIPRAPDCAAVPPLGLSAPAAIRYGVRIHLCTYFFTALSPIFKGVDSCFVIIYLQLLLY